jgi:hypothetical protein
MAITPTSTNLSEQGRGDAATGNAGSNLQALAKRHLWMHFTRMGVYADSDVPVIVRGEGCTSISPGICRAWPSAICGCISRAWAPSPTPTCR